VCAATLNATLPEPDPVAPATRLIQAALLVAVQLHPAPAVTVLLPDPPSLANAWLVGVAEYVQAAPDCETVNVAPAIVSVPDRLVVEVFAATLNPALPGPVPEVPLVTVIHGALLVVLHVQPADVVTFVLPLPPAAPSDCADDEMLNEQLALACVTVKVRPAIVRVPVRPPVVDAFAATLKPTLPAPDPEAPLVTVIQELLLDAVQPQLPGAVTPLAPAPPADVYDWLEGEMAYVQLTPA
jgi:hypothetical protein